MGVPDVCLNVGCSRAAKGGSHCWLRAESGAPTAELWSHVGELFLLFGALGLKVDGGAGVVAVEGCADIGDGGEDDAEGRGRG